MTDIQEQQQNSSNSILIATDIKRDFKTAEGSISVLKGISLDLTKGQAIAVTGASGVGKSSLLHVLGGLDKPTSGSVTVDGTDLGTKTEQELSRFRNKKIGFVFQHHYLLEDFSALENIMIPMLLSQKTRSEAKDKGELLLDAIGLSNRRTHRPHQLSGGEQQRVAVARALANDPDLILADEPSGNLDTATGKLLHDLLLSFKTNKFVSFVIATHNRELAERCDIEIEIRDGKISENK